MKNKRFIFFAIVATVAMCFALISLNAHAQESELESETDTTQNERLNSLETRLEEMGYTINEIEGVLEQVQTSELLQEEERLAISTKLDLVITALNDLVNYDIEILGKADNEELLAKEYRLQITEVLNNISNSTVSGNSLTFDLINTITSGNNDSLAYAKESDLKNEENTNTRFLALVCVVGVAVGAVLSLLVSSWFRKGK